MQIYIVKCLVHELVLTQVSADSSKDVEKAFSIDYSVEFNEPRKFSVIFDIAITHSHQYEFKMKYAGVFRTDEDIDEPFKNSPFPTINAPAITFPYMRAFIATITLNSGFEAAMLPTLNFITLSKNRSEGKVQYKL